MHYACQLGKFEIVKYLISLNKFDLKQTDIIINTIDFNSIFKEIKAF